MYFQIKEDSCDTACAVSRSCWFGRDGRTADGMRDRPGTAEARGRAPHPGQHHPRPDKEYYQNLVQPWVDQHKV
ncbi:hypothetical protein GCM10020220_090120 [Nonomuraea rubra]